MSVATANQTPDMSVIHEVVTKGDLSNLTDAQKSSYYVSVCQSVGLNPLTQPFEYLKLNGKLILYAKKGATDQLRSIHGINITDTRTEYMDELIVVTVFGQDRSGRQDSEIGAVTIGGLRGDAKANAIMKALTKAKRRLTLSMCGLGMLDESEVETIPNARPVPVQRVHETEVVDHATGEIVEPSRPQRVSERRSRFDTPRTENGIPDHSGGPVERQAEADRTTPITDQTMKRLHVVASEAQGWQHDELTLIARRRMKLASTKEMTELQAKALIKWMQDTPRDRAEAALHKLKQAAEQEQQADDPAANVLAHQDQQADDAEYREVLE